MQNGPSKTTSSNVTNLQDLSVTTEKETANELFHKFFPDVSPAQDSEQHRNIRAQILASEPPDSQIEPDFTEHEVDEVISKLDIKKCPDPGGINGAIVKNYTGPCPPSGRRYSTNASCWDVLPKNGNRLV
jgi:phosphatidylethanolamine-binding protein (PEBP) family uncharacterized protein